jgi:hypothetical protein
MPWGRRRFENLEVVAQFTLKHPENFMDLLELLYGLSRDIFQETNHVTAYDDPNYPEWKDRHSAPFDSAALFFKLEEGDEVVRLLQINHRDDFNPN